MKSAFRARSTPNLALAVSLAAAVTIASTGAWAQPHLTTLYSFCAKSGCSDGLNTGGNTPLLSDSQGNFYGMTPMGGERSGTMFQLSFNAAKGKWKLKTLYGFPKAVDGEEPMGRLIVDNSGAFYGTTFAGGKDNEFGGIAFKLAPNAGHAKWRAHPIYSFCQSGATCLDGKQPAASGLTYTGADSGAPYDGVSPLFGTTAEGGAHNQGTVFELTFDIAKGKWTETVLHDFCAVQNGSQCLDGTMPNYGLTIDAGGNLFGTAFGGTNDVGLIYELSPQSGNTWQYTVLYNFCGSSCGSFPHGGLIRDASGNLYGTAGSGIHAAGIIFKLVPNGTNSQLTDLYDFCSLSNCTDGGDPLGGLAMDSSGILYGTTEHGGANRTDTMGEGGGTIFKFSNGSLQTLYNFCGKTNCKDGEYPQASLTPDAQGNFFGTTTAGGTHASGTVFELSAAVPKS